MRSSGSILLAFSSEGLSWTPSVVLLPAAAERDWTGPRLGDGSPAARVKTVKEPAHGLARHVINM